MKPGTRAFYVDAIQRTLERIAASLDDAIDSDQLARDACLSRFHFHRIFRGVVGETPLELHRRLRLERAAWQLAQTDAPVTRIAMDAGYETHESFTRAFRGSYSASPSEFRSRRHPRSELAASSGIHFTPDGVVPPFIHLTTGDSPMTAEIMAMPALRVGTIRHVGPYNQIPQAFEKLGAIVHRTGLLRQPGTAMLALYHDDPDSTPTEQLRSDAAFVIPAPLPMPDGLTEQHLPAGPYAMTTHIGPYEQLGDAWSRFYGDWLLKSGRQVADSPSYEIYRNDPTTTKKEELRTELYIPLR